MLSGSAPREAIRLARNAWKIKSGRRCRGSAERRQSRKVRAHEGAMPDNVRDGGGPEMRDGWLCRRLLFSKAATAQKVPQRIYRLRSPQGAVGKGEKAG